MGARSQGRAPAATHAAYAVRCYALTLCRRAVGCHVSTHASIAPVVRTEGGKRHASRTVAYNREGFAAVTCSVSCSAACRQVPSLREHARTGQ